MADENKKTNLDDSFFQNLPSNIHWIPDTEYAQSVDESIEIVEHPPLHQRDTLKGLFPDDFLIINDIILADVPTSAISIESTNDVFVAETLRSSSPVVSTKGNQSVTLNISLVFPPGGDTQSSKLRRLVSELQYHPLVYIYNGKIRKALNIEDASSNIIFIFETGTLRSDSEHVGSIILDMTLHYFNYKPFSNHFWYNTNLPWNVNDPKQREVARPKELSLTGLTSYETSSFSLDYEAEKLFEDLQSGAININPNSPNVPVNMPLASEAWMYYARHMYSNTWDIPEYPGDYVGIELRRYEQRTPKKSSQRAGAGVLSDIFRSIEDSDLRKVHPVYKLRAPMVHEEGTVASEREAERSQSTPKTKDGRIPVTFQNANSGQEATRQLIDSDGKIIAESHYKFSEICYKPKQKQTYKDKGILVDAELIYMVQKVVDRFPEKKLTIFSGIRGYGKGKHRHAMAKAIDFSVKGVSNKELFTFIATTFKAGGAGWYPNNHPSGGSHFVHMDSDTSEGMRLWADESGRGKDSAYNKNNEVLVNARRIRRTPSVNSEKDIQEEAIHLKEAELEFSEESSELYDSDFDPNPQTIDTQPDEIVKEDYRKALDRANWISDIRRAEGLEYYSEDIKLRNIFYKDKHVYISSEPIARDIVARDEVFAAKNMVTSAISVTFGNRIVPHKLLGQDRSTWQFLGAGNKTGTLVFTFAGEEGRESSDNVKKLIYESRDNAKLFGSLIQEAGSIKLSWNSPDNSRSTNSILALLASKDSDKPERKLNVIVTDFSEQSDPSGSDKHQLVVNFIVQNFAKEGLDRNVITSLEQKKIIIRTIMDQFIVSGHIDAVSSPVQLYANRNDDLKSNRDYWVIAPNPEYIVYRNRKEVEHEAAFQHHTGTQVAGQGRPYKTSNVRLPGWLLPIIIQAAEITNESNKELPRGYGKRLFDEFGAGHHMLGYQYYGTAEDTREQERKAARVFNRWTDDMDGLVKQVIANSMSKDFSKYFGNINNDIIEALTAQISECYQDMDLPSVPNGNIPLGPDFYVYDDSHEDPALSSFTDDYKMEQFLMQHISNERASVRHYMEDTLLGGSYASRSLPRIMENRKYHMEQLGGASRDQGEIKFMNFGQMMAEGTQTWEPVFYRSKDEVYQKGKTKEWVNRISDGDETNTRKTFFQKLISLSPYIGGKSRHWVSGGNQPDDLEELVYDIYDDNWNKTAFGPNQDYKYVDSVVTDGTPFTAGAEQAREEVKKTNEELDRERLKNNKQLKDLVSNQALTEDGAITFGNNKAEQEALESKGRWSSLLDEVGEQVGDVAYSALSSLASGLAPILGLAKLVAPIEALVRSRKEISSLLSSMDHTEAIQLFDENIEDKTRARAAAGIGVGTKTKDLSIRRAFPTFKIYFIEDDEEGSDIIHGRSVKAFDDFYSSSAVQEIHVIRSRKVASNLAVLRITNVGGKLLRKRFGEKSQYQKDYNAKYGIEAEYETGLFADTEKENPFESMILQDGVKVQIRLGYTSNPDHLETVFLGSIVEISTQEDGRILEITCQGFGAELEGVELGPLEDGPVFYSSQQALAGSIIQDSIVNFGRRNKVNRFNAAEMRHQFTGGSGSGFLSNASPASFFAEWAKSRQTRQMFKYPFLNYPQDDNIYAPPPHVYTETWDRFWNNACTYRPLKQTPWQIFKEHELRHPGYISLAVPYGHSSRMTMFFGAKSQHYWAHPPSNLEIFLSERASEEIVRLRGLSAKKLHSVEFRQELVAIAKQDTGLANAIIKGISSFSRPMDASFQLGKMFGRYRPFRNFHYFDSSHHILKNNIRTSRDGTFNEVEVLYFNNENDIEEGNPDELLSNIEELTRGEAESMACQLDENIPEEYINSYREEFPSCITDTMARRYVQGLFARLLRDCYKGELCVLGEPTLKPYDVCMLNDSSINMTGPIEVEQVEHIFNRDHGFISIITPDLCIDVNDYYTASTLSLTAASMAYAFGLNDPSSAMAIASFASPMMALGWMAGVKLIKYTQDGVPVVATPLVLNGKPLISVSMGQKRGSLWASWHGQWNQYWDDLSNAWEKFDIAESFFDTALSISENVFSLAGAPVGDSIQQFEE